MDGHTSSSALQSTTRELRSQLITRRPRIGHVLARWYDAVRERLALRLLKFHLRRRQVIQQRLQR